MPLHNKASWEYAGHHDCCADAGPELRPVPTPLPQLPAPLKSKRPTRRPDASSALGAARGYRTLGRRAP